MVLWAVTVHYRACWTSIVKALLSRLWWIKLHENLIPKSTVFLMASLLSSLHPAESSSHMCALLPNTNSPVIHSTALSRLKRLDVRVSQRRTEFYPSPHHEEFMMDKVALRQGFYPRISVAPCQYHPTNAPCPFVYHRCYVKLATGSVSALDPLSRWPVFMVHWPPFILLQQSWDIADWKILQFIQAILRTTRGCLC
jgi:hypothetical protein